MVVKVLQSTVWEWKWAKQQLTWNRSRIQYGAMTGFIDNYNRMWFMKDLKIYRNSPLFKHSPSSLPSYQCCRPLNCVPVFCFEGHIIVTSLNYIIQKWAGKKMQKRKKIQEESVLIFKLLLVNKLLSYSTIICSSVKPLQRQIKAQSDSLKPRGDQN